MLKEIYCPLFKHRKVSFQKGLNVILGDNNASNSIGKSTMLLIIDYVFGGDSYSKSEVIDHIGHHAIYFQFCFGGDSYYFCRNTEQGQTVFITDEKYEVEKEISIVDFRDFLHAHYNIDENVSFREMVGLNSRVYGKENCEEKRVLNLFSKQSNSDAVLGIIKCFGAYGEIKHRIDAKRSCEERYKVFCNAIKLHFVNTFSGKKDLLEAEKGINLQYEECRLLEHQLLTDTSVLTPVQVRKISELKDDMSNVLLSMVAHKKKLGKLQANIGKIKGKVTINIDKLKSYFPSVNLAEIEKINQFHEGLVKALHQTILSQVEKEQNVIDVLKVQEAKIKSQIDTVASLKTANKAVLDRFIELKKSIDSKEKSIADYKQREALQKEKKEAKEMLEKVQDMKLDEIQNEMNEKISSLNQQIEGNNKQAPVLRLSSKSYCYQCLDDCGTGTNFKNLVIFDLAVLALTKLPIVIHDSLLFKNIEKKRMDAIMKIYSEERDKQIFISFDQLADFSKTTQNIADECKVLSLSPGGNELFGESWNSKN